ncbi:MAG: electron transfer flavoprotein subunit beta/FixA family protein [Synergistaceae bacterium]|nr:electron transfer flavoprotein subunit beta/FixA family protein [Synergistaceae bacterium]
MRIVVLVKQVPAVDNVKIDEKTGTMVREGVEAELNPLDLHAVEAAVRIKESMAEGSVEITAITMGPPQAKKAAAYAVSMGCDRGVLVSDNRFGGSDTLATSRTLAKAIEKLGPFDILFAGERATDGETGQVGPAAAEFLNIPALTYVSSIDELEDKYIRVTRSIEGGHEMIGSPLPVMVIPLKEMNIPRLCTLGGKLRAKKTEIPVLDADDIGLDENSTGLKGSATWVINVTYPQMTREGRKITSSGRLNETVETLVNFLEEKNCLGAAK